MRRDDALCAASACAARAFQIKAFNLKLVSDVSIAMSKDMKKRGIGFVGPVITYSFLQSIGIVNDHLDDCEYR